ncbi:sensor histidine kinase [Thaumasiovibrio sp. DFM-14]|uniref:sensor histidine kinase n=1 Tax=Thaumasiovibrio sp. DFM-14 TaxID=3384792 RepID=UPI0039A200D6
MAKATDLNNKPYPSIYRKIRWAFGVPTLLMFAIFWGMVYMAENKLEIISLEHWLDTEYARYSRDYQKLGEQAPLPNRYEFYTFRSDKKVPQWLSEYENEGFYGHKFKDETRHFLVRPHPADPTVRLYILFQDHADDYLNEYEAQLHLMAFILGTLVTLGVLGYSYYFIRSVSAPLAAIERKIPLLSPESPQFKIDSHFRETRHIEQALLSNKTEIEHFFQREQEFSRFASHELRTPITVIRGSAELLAKLNIEQPLAQKAIQRIQTASTEMSLLTDAFLLLGKAEIPSHFIEHVQLRHQLEQQLISLNPLFEHCAYNYHLQIEPEPSYVLAPTSFVAILMNNLFKNAANFATGDIDIHLQNQTLTIRNQYNPQDHSGYGCGLVIVERICERMDWIVTIIKEAEMFTIEVKFK